MRSLIQVALSTPSTSTKMIVSTLALGSQVFAHCIVIMLRVHLTAAHGWPMLRLIALPNFNISLDIRSALVMGDVGAGAINFEPRATQKSSDPNFSVWVAH